MTTADADHLRLLSVFHYVAGGLGGICSCVPFLHLAFGIGIVTGQVPGPANSPLAPHFGWFVVGFASLAIVLGWTFSIALMVAGNALRNQRHYTFCMVVAAISCASVPLGTALGVCTLMVLLRPAVKATFTFKTAKPAGDDWGPIDI